MDDKEIIRESLAEVLTRADHPVHPFAAAQRALVDMKAHGAVLVLTDLATNQVMLDDGITAPASVSGRAIIYVDTADGDLKIVFGDGTVKTIVVDT